MKYFIPTILALFIILVVTSCGKKQETTEEETIDTVETATVPTLTPVWETDTLLKTCESVLYDPGKNILYVSNINGNPDDGKKTGFISKVSLDGKITEEKWVTGLTVPTGMGLYDGKLYVAEKANITVIDTETGKILKSYPVPGATFLNDVTVDSNGTVYVSDSQSGFITTLKGDTLKLWLDSLDGPNGLFIEEGRLLSALWNPKTLSIVDLATGEYTLKTEGLENPDGIEAVGDGGYLVSSWNGRIHYIDSNWKKALILDTTPESVSAADIEYIPERNLLLVPTFFSNKVMAYELSK